MCDPAALNGPTHRRDPGLRERPWARPPSMAWHARRRRAKAVKRLAKIADRAAKRATKAAKAPRLAAEVAA
jgi:hypothetical protein